MHCKLPWRSARNFLVCRLYSKMSRTLSKTCTIKNRYVFPGVTILLNKDGSILQRGIPDFV